MGKICCGSDQRLADRFFAFNQELFSGFPWQVAFCDWTGRSYSLGGDKLHWTGENLQVTVKTPQAAKTLMACDVLGFLDKFVEGEVDLTGNLYLLTEVKLQGKFFLKPLQGLFHLLANKAFQNIYRARKNVKSHYDIPQEAANVYLDKKYMSYSCGMFEKPNDKIREELTRVGVGEHDTFDSLEKAQWRKYKDAVDWVNPEKGETLLDIGCGYGGQLIVALENYPFGKVVGWTISSNQVSEGRKMLAVFDSQKWELLEGDYREETRKFDHVTSTGMISHVGPHGLVPYIRNVRQLIKTGGRYLHHALMTSYSKVPFDFQVGVAFNKKYVWPGFHWFTPGVHVRALEENGFRVHKLIDLSPHYSKTAAAWYERLMSEREVMVKNLEEKGCRAWQVYLAGASGGFTNGSLLVCRLYCEAI